MLYNTSIIKGKLKKNLAKFYFSEYQCDRLKNEDFFWNFFWKKTALSNNFEFGVLIIIETLKYTRNFFSRRLTT